MSFLLFLIPLFPLSILLYGIYQVWYASTYPKRNVRGKVVLITGGGRGLGRLQADRFAKLGAKLILWDVNEENLERAKSELSKLTQVQIQKVDISNPSEVASAAESAGPVDFLINNAGIRSNLKSVAELSDSEVDRVLSINAISHFTTVRAFLPGMIERKFGHITCIASAAGHVGVGWLSDYCAAKHALMGLMEALRFELLVMNAPITTSTICPLFVATPMLENAPEGSLVGPLLAADDVADRIVGATVRGEEIVFVPESLSLVLQLIRMLPVKLQMRILGPKPFGYVNYLI
jgi:all-trans-retinol dehydrogenase (NAD+)